ncbi:MAG: substrate-binding domain-containing protein [Actinobacteria bacterium]|nr:substrate-binding domain-containing protein [Actinomycetota bacterium]
MKKIIIWLLVITISISMVVVFSLSGCKKQATETTAGETTAAETTAAETSVVAEEQERYVFWGYWGSPVWGFGAAGALKAAEVIGGNVKIEFAGPSGFDQDKMLKALETSISTKPTGIFGLPFELGEGELLTKYHEDGGLTAGWLVKPVSWPWDVTAGVNFTEMAHQFVQWLVDIRTAQGKPMKFKLGIGSIAGSAPMEERYNAIIADLKKYPDVEVVGPIIDEGTSAEIAQQNSTAYVTANPDVEVYLIMPSEVGGAVFKALKEAGFKPGDKTFLTMDWTPDIKQGIIEGYINGALNFHFGVEAYWDVLALHQLYLSKINKGMTVTANSETDAKYGYIPMPRFLESTLYRIEGPDAANDFNPPTAVPDNK